jgi:type II secretory pathway component PulK
MRISVHGTDRGSALLSALALIIILSTLAMAFIPRISATRQYARDFKRQVMDRIEMENREILDTYDLH